MPLMCDTCDLNECEQYDNLGYKYAFIPTKCKECIIISKKICATCGLKEREMDTWYFTDECRECNNITREKAIEELKNKPPVRKIVRKVKVVN